MFTWRNTWLPDGETHLVDWMKKMRQERHGHPCYQLHKYDLAMQFVRQRRVAVDVGAHVGLWTRVMAHDFRTVNCFEPVQAHRACWYRNLAGAENAQMFAYALGAEPGRVVMHTGPSSSGDTWVDPNALDDAAAGVEMVTLDSFDLQDVDFIKIDCEGYELKVLEGAQATLLRCRPCVIVEQKPGHAEKYGWDDLAGVTFLESIGAVRRGGIQGDFVLSWPEA